jgi:chromosome segregation ATPase
MRIAKTLAWCCLLCLLAGWALPDAAAPASEGKDSPAAAIQGAEATLAKLLAEVHQLRVALQRATLANTRFQMAIERMRIQQAHVDAVQRELDGVRSELANLEDAKAGTIDRLKDAEERSKLETGPEQDSLEEEARRIKQAVASIERELQGRHGREAELIARLQQEENRLEDLDHQLDALTEELKDQSSVR